MKILMTPLALALAGGLIAAPTVARAAQSYDNCTGFVTSLPTTITTPGTWCLDKHLSTAISTGAAITIAASNVTLDCNDFKVGGLAAGPASYARGVYALERQNITVRNCAIRGFWLGIELDGGGGHRVSHNRLEQNLTLGIYVSGENNRVSDNDVLDTGGYAYGNFAGGISASADIIDNTVSGVFTDRPTEMTLGIQVTGEGQEVRGNRVRRVLPGAGVSHAIQTNGGGNTFTGNTISAPQASTPGVGLLAYGFCTGNTVLNYATPYTGCAQGAGNLALPAAE